VAFSRSSILGRSGITPAIAALALGLALAASLSTDAITAAGSGDRTISFYHIHTQERLTVTYKKGGAYIPEAMKQIDWIMRDWRKNQAIKIDPSTIDLAWEMHEELGSKDAISIICGYRSQGTNAMLRRTVGGQANQSQHITGKAIDITFPDVPLKRMRYSALVRERGGVGYYPTSGIPFVHLDTARVRSWPRLPRYELALVFPEGRSRHQPAEGGSITPADVRVAQSKYRDLAMQVAEFHDIRRGVKAPTLVASAAPAAADTETPRKTTFTVASLTDAGPRAATPPRKIDLKWETLKQAAEPKRPVDIAAAPKQVASLGAQPDLAKPKLVSEPKLVDRPSRFTPSPTKAERGKLDALVLAAANMPMPKLVKGPAPAVRPQKAMAAVAASVDGATPPLAGQQVASLAPEKSATSITDMSPDSLGNGWVQAPAFDEDHPEELAYRPFPLSPLLTETASAHAPELVGLQHPDVAATLDAIDDAGAVMPMKFRPGQQVAQVMWAQQFQGKAVHLEALTEIDRSRLPAGIESRPVKTSAR
jgi:uncharacterized protein YcbK (DUF882 family)